MAVGRDLRARGTPGSWQLGRADEAAVPSHDSRGRLGAAVETFRRLSPAENTRASAVRVLRVVACGGVPAGAIRDACHEGDLRRPGAGRPNGCCARETDRADRGA